MIEASKVCKAIAPFLTFGAVINTGWRFHLGEIFKPKTWLRNIACWQIQRYQKHFFGGRSRYRAVHTRIYLGSIEGSHKYFDPTASTIFEVTSPRSQFVSLWDICDSEDIRILHYTPRRLTSDDVLIMRKAAAQIQGTEYDYGQLMDFLLYRLLGFPKESIKLFDQGPERKVCSTAVASLYHFLRAELEKSGGDPIPRLFDIINVAAWQNAGIYHNIDQCLDPSAMPGVDRIRTPIERVTPAHFENSNFFIGEFRQAARFVNGERVA